MIHITKKKIQIKGLKETYKFLHVTDSHLMCFGEEETKARYEYALPRVDFFSKDGISPDMRWKAYIDYANENKLSGVLITGDIVDFPSRQNMEMMNQTLESLEVPYVFAPGNHDWNYFDDYQTENAILNNRPLIRNLCGGDEDFHVQRVGELTFVALDNTADVYRLGTAARLKEALIGAENVIVLQHVPLYCDTLREDTIQYWGEDLTLGGKGIRKDGSADEVREILLASDAVKAILCGHLHFAHEDMLGGILLQYVAPYSCHGDVTLIEMEGD